MEHSEESVIVSLLDKDPELKKYYDEHLALEKQLATFQHKGHLTPDEEIEMNPRSRSAKMRVVEKLKTN